MSAASNYLNILTLLIIAEMRLRYTMDALLATDNKAGGLIAFSAVAIGTTISKSPTINLFSVIAIVLWALASILALLSLTISRVRMDPDIPYFYYHYVGELKHAEFMGQLMAQIQAAIAANEDALAGKSFYLLFAAITMILGLLAASSSLLAHS